MSRSSPPPPDPDAAPLVEGSRAPFVIGVLGGIASGKSAVAERLAGARGRVLSADAIAHEVLGSDAVREQLLAHFGPEALDSEGRPDRAFLARRVFAPGAARERALLEGWTHPLVRARILERLEEARAAGVPRVVLDVPLLLENDARHGLAGLCDALVFVDVDAAERDRRARASRGWQAGELARREAAQLPLAQKRARAGYHVSNRQSLRDLDDEVARVLREMGLE